MYADRLGSILVIWTSIAYLVHGMYGHGGVAWLAQALDKERILGGDGVPRSQRQRQCTSRIDV